MPEGPEVKAVAEWLNSLVTGKKMMFKSGGYLIRHSIILSVVSKGKLILFTFSETPHLLIHFGLYGNLKLMKSANQDSLFAFKHGKRCGEMLITIQSDELFDNKLVLGLCSGTGSSFKWVTNQFDEMDKLGPDAMNESAEFLCQRILKTASKRKSVDSILTDQHIISGIGKRWRQHLFELSQLDSATKLEKIKDLLQFVKLCINVGQSMYNEFQQNCFSSFAAFCDTL